MSNPRPLLYNPDQKQKGQLIDEFVIRQKEFGILMNGLSSASLQNSPQHYLIVGQRGMGKTTLLLRVKYAIEDDPLLSVWVIPVKFSEEQYQIATLDRLWEEIAEHLEMADPAFDGLLAEMEEQEDADDYERIALDLLTKTIKKHKKRVLVMIDNLGDLFKKLSDLENHRFREVLLSHTELQLIGASSVMLEHTFSYDKPFFEFFQQIILQPINKENALELLENLGKQYNQQKEVNQLISDSPEKIETLRRLTGGVPRTIALLFSIFIDHQKGSTYEDLLLLLDQVNSFYKHRMDDLKPQQQRIVDVLAKAWDPISTKEVLLKSKLDREGIESNQVSAQLSILAANQVVEVINGKGKLKTYRIRERFFNIWYLMRYGKRQHKEEVLWLVRFLESWCNKKELQFQADQQLAALQDGTYSPKAAYLKTMALYHTKGIDPGRKLELLERTESHLKLLEDDANARAIGKIKGREMENYLTALMQKYDSYIKISRMDIPAALNPELVIYLIISFAIRLWNIGKPLLAITDILLKGIELGDVDCMALMGMAFHDTEFDKAEKYYLMAVDHDHIDALYNLGRLYQNDKKKYDLAEKYYRMAIDQGHISAMYNLGNLYQNDKEEYVLAEKYYLMAIEQGHISSMYNLAILYANAKKGYDLAEKYYLLAIDNGHVNAMNNLANLYNDKENYDLAERYYLMAVENGHVNAMNNLGNLYKNNKKDQELSEKYYLMAIAKGDVRAMFNLGYLYHYDKKDNDLAEKYYLMAIDKGNVRAMFNLGFLNQFNKKDLPLAEKYYKMAHDFGVLKASIALISIYAENNRTADMLMLASELLSRQEVLEDTDVTFKLITSVFAKKQYHFLLQHFQKPESQLMKYARPMYYVLMWFMRDEMPGEYEKVGPEIKETVDEIVQQVLRVQKENESLVQISS